jgi:hypothetical protein
MSSMYFTHQHSAITWLTKNPRLNLTTDSAGALLAAVLAARTVPLIQWTGEDIEFMGTRAEIAAVSAPLALEFDHRAAATELVALANSAVLQSAAALEVAKATLVEVSQSSFTASTASLQSQLGDLEAWMTAHGLT